MKTDTLKDKCHASGDPGIKKLRTILPKCEIAR
jgi:hypothetical protein